MSGPQSALSPQNDEGENQLASSIQHHRMDEKRELRDLNNRLEMFVRHQRDGRSEVNRLKKLIAETEVDFRQKIKDSEKHYQLSQDKTMAENEQLNIQIRTLRVQLDGAEKARQNAETRCVGLDQAVTRKSAELELKDQKLKALQSQLEALMNELVAVKASVKASKNDEQLTGQLQEQCDQWKSKFEATCEELAKIKCRHKCQVDSYQRALTEKTEESEKLKEQLKDHVKKSQGLETQVRKEFDTKMTEFVEKREAQYQSEKEEWMKIFKEEYQKKIAQFKETNTQLAESTKKLEVEMNELKQRLARVRREKAELDAGKHSLEEELEKVRNDIDELRQRKDEEIREKLHLLSSLQETLKQKEIEFEELSGAKVQLDNEIALYRNILSEAEKDAGYANPLASEQKKRKIDSRDGPSVPTPGLTRARQVAKQDLQCVGTSSNKSTPLNLLTQEEEEQEQEQENDINEEGEDADANADADADDENDESEENDENKDEENFADRTNISNKNAVQNPYLKNNPTRKRKHPEQNDYDKINYSNNHDGSDSQETPGELFPLQFSTMDLCSSTLEVQNISNHPIALKGFYLTNSDNSKKFLLPANRTLSPGERVKIIVGSASDLKVLDGDLWWRENVWSGVKDEVARLCDPSHKEIATIEISLDMLPEKFRTRKNCLIM